MPNTYHLNTATDTPFAAQLLVFLAEHTTTNSRRSFVKHQTLGGPGSTESNKLDTCTLMLGDGIHTVLYKGIEFTVTVDPLVADGKKLLTHDDSSATIHGKDVFINGIQDIKELMLEASTFVNSLFRSNTTEQYIFNAKYGSIRRIQSVVPRTALFLKRGEQKRLFDAVDLFLHGRDDYARFNVPYKLNVMLHGLPGTGKTSTIAVIASHFGISLTVVPFSKHLDDDTLPKALHQSSTAGCKMIVLEDIDSFLAANTTTLTMSGLLNCLDGLMRGDGLIVVLTANSIEKINVDCHALLRTARIDMALEFTHADEFQTRSAFDHYFPLLDTTVKETADEAWARFWAVAKPLHYSVAALQQFFFRARGKGSLRVEDFCEIANGLFHEKSSAEFYT